MFQSLLNVRSARFLVRSDRRRSLLLTATPVAETLELRQLLSSDPVLDWNGTMLEAIRVDSTPPPAASRAMAIVHTAIFDAVNSISREYEPYLTRVVVHPRASQDAAVAGAAHQALVALFPAQKTTFDAKLTESLAAIPDGKSEDDGVAAGKAVADQILLHRLNDGSADSVTWVPGTQPGEWVPTPPGFAPGLLPQWPDVDLWAVDSVDRYVPGPPPKLTSAKYAKDLNQVQKIGSATSTVRTADQTAIAQFWANGAGTSTPPGHWNQIAGIVAEQRDLSVGENARLFALLNLALADSAIVCWSAKYDYDLWRPVTAIREADTDGNPRTQPDPQWSSLLVTPPFPSYSSGHSTFSGAAAAVLKAYFRTDRVQFVAPSETAGVADRAFSSFREAAEESGISRIYGGIHYQFDNISGLKSGRKIGEFVSRRLLKPDTGPATARVENGELIVAGTARSERLKVQERGNIFDVTANGRRIGTFSAVGITLITVDAGAGNDHVTVANVGMGSHLYGGAGNDRLIGGQGNDRLFGEDGHDVLSGNAGNDELDGGSGRNFLYGNAGNDTLHGVRGLDRLFGGPGLNNLLWQE